MNAYKRVLLALVIFTVVLAATVPFLKDSDGAVLVSLLVLFEVVGDIASTLYIFGLVTADRRQPRSWLLLMLFTTSLLVTLGVGSIGLVVALRFLGYPPLSNGLGLLIVGTGIVLLGSVPIIKAVLFFMVARDRAIAGERREVS